MDRDFIIKFPINIGTYSMFVQEILELAQLKKSAVVCVANVHMFIEAHKDPQFFEVINNAKLVTPDGRPLIWALQILHGKIQERVTGMDLLPMLLKKMELRNFSVFFYGGTEAMLDDTKAYLETNFPNLKIAGFHSPPFGIDNNLEDKDIILKINELKPSVIFVVLGCPKQEKWMSMMKDKIDSVMIGIGGALPVMLGMHKRAPLWMQKNGLEWLYRLSQEPRRLFKRYFSTNSLFLWILLKEYMRIKIAVPLGFSKNSA